MQITVVGDEIRVDGTMVAAIAGPSRKEVEAFRAAMRDAPDMTYNSGDASFLDEDLPAQLEAAEQECDELRDEIRELERKQEEIQEVNDDLWGICEDAMEALKNGDADGALKILAKSGDLS